MLDILLLNIIFLSIILGFYRGFLESVINLFTIVGSIILAFIIYPYSQEIFTKYFDNVVLLFIIPAILSYVIALSVCKILKIFLNYLICFISGGIVDRIFGFLFGFLRGGIICLFLISILLFFSSTDQYLESEYIGELDLLNQEDPDWLYKSHSLKILKFSTKLFQKIYPDTYNNISKIELLSFIETRKTNEDEDLEKDSRKDNKTIIEMLKNIFS